MTINQIGVIEGIIVSIGVGVLVGAGGDVGTGL